MSWLLARDSAVAFNRNGRQPVRTRLDLDRITYVTSPVLPRVYSVVEPWTLTITLDLAPAAFRGEPPLNS